jgi:hypothetical protein
MVRGYVHRGFWCENLREGDHFDYPSADGKMILKWIFKKWDGGRTWAGYLWHRRGTDSGFYKYRNKH